MIAFVKNHSLIIQKKKFILLYLLNMTDILFTVLLLQTGYFKEANIFMAKIVVNPVAGVLLKMLLPALMLGYLYRQLQEDDEEQLRVSNIAVNFSLTVYTLVNLSHLVWTALLPYFMYLNR
ncbi:hypothetical protein HNQ56_003118 [Anaerotaenia torta]|uniref:DUF5658 family protein n=1 Tax=Anaerotaenia torta TaxID=433293 RepID=UPI003D25F976